MAVKDMSITLTIDVKNLSKVMSNAGLSVEEAGIMLHNFSWPCMLNYWANAAIAETLLREKAHTEALLQDFYEE